MQRTLLLQRINQHRISVLITSVLKLVSWLLSSHRNDCSWPAALFMFLNFNWIDAAS